MSSWARLLHRGEDGVVLSLTEIAIPPNTPADNVPTVAHLFQCHLDIFRNKICLDMETSLEGAMTLSK